MMRKIAPLDTKEPGFGAAYAWLAADRFSRNQRIEGKFSKEEMDELVKDLEQAVEWEGVSEGLIRLYAQAKFERGKPDESIKTLKELSDKHPDLQFLLAEISSALSKNRELLAIADQNPEAAAKIREYEKEFANASTNMMKLLADRIKVAKEEKGRGEPNDFRMLGRLLQLKGYYDRAIQAANVGLGANVAEKDPAKQIVQARDLTVLLSDCFLNKYEAAVAASGPADPTALRLLDQAVRIYPSNPKAIDYVAAIVSQQGGATTDMLQALEQSLADNSASFITYMILANDLLAKQNFDEAVSHLRFALRRAPRNPVALNNLAFALISGEKKNPQEALESIDLALRSMRANDPASASMLDTKGQVLEALEKMQGAIDCYEQALQIQPDKKGTRERIVAAYEKMGMQSMADLQRKELMKMQEEMAAAKESAADSTETSENVNSGT